MSRKGKIIIASVVVVAIAVLVYWFYFRNPYANVVVGEMQTATVTVNGVEYVFSKEGNILGIFPYDESHYPKNAILSPQEGETYQWLGIEITIAEVHVDRFVLNIKAAD